MANKVRSAGFEACSSTRMAPTLQHQWHGMGGRLEAERRQQQGRGAMGWAERRGREALERLWAPRRGQSRYYHRCQSYPSTSPKATCLIRTPSHINSTIPIHSFQGFILAPRKIGPKGFLAKIGNLRFFPQNFTKLTSNQDFSCRKMKRPQWFERIKEIFLRERVPRRSLCALCKRPLGIFQEVIIPMIASQ